MKTRIFSEALVVSTMVLLCLAQIAGAQGVISLPWTGQDKCYNSSGAEISCAGTRQDGDVQAGVDWPSPRFTVSGDCVTDNLTGLMWAKNANLANKAMTWEKGLDYVSSINSGSGLCGYKDWYLPNINELESLVNAGESNTATWLKSQGFSNVKPDYYWSSTTFAHDAPQYAWPVNMEDGNTAMFANPYASGVPIHPKSNPYYVWPVREDTAVGEAPARVWKTGQATKYHSGDDGNLEKGVAWPSPRFTDHGDGTVTDNLTGLMWSKEADPMAVGGTTWEGALDYVKTLNTGKYSDWRLPNRKELFSLIDHSTVGPAFPGEVLQVFQNVHYMASACFYWSSTTNANYAANAWMIPMWGGHLYGAFSKTFSNYLYIWPVRSTQGPSVNPVISVTPNPVQFGTVIVGSNLDKSITVKNAGGANLNIGAITSPSSPFTKTTDNCSDQTLSPGATCTVTYRFTPDSAITFTGNSNIRSNDPGKGTVTVTLTGIGSDSSLPSLQVSKSGTGDGKVTSTPAGIDCGSTCTGTYDQGTTVTLTATPSSGSVFAGWSGACSGTGDCVVTMNSNKSVTATFNLQSQYSLTVLKAGTGDGTVTSSPVGISCGSACSEAFQKVTKVKLTAKTNPDSIFTGWSGGGYSGTKPCNVNVNSAVTITASFEKKVPHISVSPNSLDFAGVKIGRSLKKTLKIVNNGTGDLSVSIGGVGGTDFSVAGSTNITVKPNKSYNLGITFKPSSTGDKTATLLLNSNDLEATTISISLTGTGI